MLSSETTKRLEADIEKFYQILLSKKKKVAEIMARYPNYKKNEAFKIIFICNTLFNIAIVICLAIWLF